MLTPTATAPTMRLAIYRTTSIGDVVLATACLDLLDQLPIPTEVTWIGRGAPLAMISAAWPHLKTLEVSRSDSLSDLQKAVDGLSGMHLLIDLQRNLRSQWLARHLRSSHGVPYFSADKAQLRRSRLLLEARMRGRRKPMPEEGRKARRPQYEMMVDALRQGLKQHLPIERHDGIDTLAVRPRLPVPDDIDNPWRKELRFGAWLAIAPGAAHPTKQAPLPLLISVLERVGRRMTELNGKAPKPLGLLFLGDNNDRQTVRQLMDRLHWNGPVMNLAGKLSLWENAVALRESTVLLSNDSSLGHIAEAVDTPTAVMFGPTVESFGFGPRMRQSKAFSAPIGCRPCSKHGKVVCRYDDKLCFEALSAEEIAGHIANLLVAPEARHVKRPPMGPEALSPGRGDTTVHS